MQLRHCCSRSAYHCVANASDGRSFPDCRDFPEEYNDGVYQNPFNNSMPDVPERIVPKRGFHFGPESSLPESAFPGAQASKKPSERLF